MSEVGSVQRVRITFSKGAEIKFISHLAVMRAWERIVRRADLPMAYSQGFNPRPKLAFASALSVGHTGRAEILDIEMRRRVQLETLPAQLEPQLPVGFAVNTAREVPLRAPSIQSQLRHAIYRVSFRARQPADVLRAELDQLLSVSELPRQRTIKGKVREYDLRPLIHDLWYDCRVAPLIENHTVCNALVVATDISDQKKSHEAIKREQQALRQILDLHERERQLVAYEIHDGFAQKLAGAQLNFEAFRQSLWGKRHK